MKFDMNSLIPKKRTGVFILYIFLLVVLLYRVYVLLYVIHV